MPEAHQPPLLLASNMLILLASMLHSIKWIFGFRIVPKPKSLFSCFHNYGARGTAVAAAIEGGEVEGGEVEGESWIHRSLGRPTDSR